MLPGTFHNSYQCVPHRHDARMGLLLRNPQSNCGTAVWAGVLRSRSPRSTLTNRSKTLYTGATSNLEQRVWQDKHHVFPGFTADYKIDRLVYFERYASIHSAIAREKQIKWHTRLKKIALIVSQNPTWKDLSAEWYEKHRFEPEHAA